MGVSTTVGVLAIIPLLPLLVLLGLRLILRLWGISLESCTRDRKDELKLQLKQQHTEREDGQNTSDEVEDGWEKVERAGSAPNGNAPSNDWDGIIGFFHPFCNAGGGGERVLWAAIAATQRRWPNAICAVYTGDHDIDRSASVAKVKDRFGIHLREDTLQFIYLTTRHFVLASTYPYFTLLGQSLGSLIVAHDAFSLLVPDIFIDTMGYAFTLAFAKYLFPSFPTAAYVHYPTISTDMLSSLDDTTGTKGIHSGAGSGMRGFLKKRYWHLFARLYGWVGRQIDVVACNSTWTADHIRTLWKPSSSTTTKFPQIIYPPCPVESLIASIPLSPTPPRQNIYLYIAQFRPEKNHSLILRAFARYYLSTSHKEPPQLVLIGSVRTNTPDERHVYNLRLEARELKINDATQFICDAPFSLIQEHLAKSSVSVNGMYAEHFGIGNVEGLAAGLIPVVHRSGGPYLDIVVPWEGKEIGFHAETEAEFAAAFEKVGTMSEDERQEMRKRGRESSRRFGEGVFEEAWGGIMGELIGMALKRQR
jgi:alpha-1,2-mannosyltransferase